MGSRGSFGLTACSLPGEPAQAALRRPVSRVEKASPCPQSCEQRHLWRAVRPGKEGWRPAGAEGHWAGPPRHPSRTEPLLGCGDPGGLSSSRPKALPLGRSGWRAACHPCEDRTELAGQATHRRDARTAASCQGPTGEHLPPTRHQPPVREGLIFSSTFQKLGKFDLAVRKFEVHSGPCDAFVSWCDGIEARSPRRITVTASLATRAGETLWCSPTQENSARAAGTQPSCRTGGAGGRAGPLGEGRQGRAAPRALGGCAALLNFYFPARVDTQCHSASVSGAQRSELHLRDSRSGTPCKSGAT